MKRSCLLIVALLTIYTPEVTEAAAWRLPPIRPARVNVPPGTSLAIPAHLLLTEAERLEEERALRESEKLRPLLVRLETLRRSAEEWRKADGGKSTLEAGRRGELFTLAVEIFRTEKECVTEMTKLARNNALAEDRAQSFISHAVSGITQLREIVELEGEDAGERMMNGALYIALVEHLATDPLATVNSSIAASSEMKPASLQEIATSAVFFGAVGLVIFLCRHRTMRRWA